MEARLVSRRVLDVDGNGVSSHDSRVLMSVINKVTKVHTLSNRLHGLSQSLWLGKRMR